MAQFKILEIFANIKILTQNLIVRTINKKNESRRRHYNIYLGQERQVKWKL